MMKGSKDIFPNVLGTLSVKEIGEKLEGLHQTKC